MAFHELKPPACVLHTAAATYIVVRCCSRCGAPSSGRSWLRSRPRCLRAAYRCCYTHCCVLLLSMPFRRLLMFSFDHREPGSALRCGRVTPFLYGSHNGCAHAIEALLEYPTIRPRSAVCFHPTPELQSALRRRGDTAALLILFPHHCLFVCLFVWIKPEKSILQSLCLEGSNNPWEWLHMEFLVCLFVWIKPGVRLGCLVAALVRLFAGISSHSEDHCAHFTRSGKQRQIVQY